MSKTDHETIYWAQYNSGPWPFYVAATEKGLCYVGSPNASFDEMALWVSKHIKHAELKENSEAMTPYITELAEYLHGNRQFFSIPLDLRGTLFQQKVWQALLEVPFGASATYTDIANSIGRPDAVRAVGTAIGANPVLIPVPCHRMFGKHGEWRGYRGGMHAKEHLVALEKLKPDTEFPSRRTNEAHS